MIVIGVCLNLMFVPMFLGFRAYVVPFMRQTAARAEAKVKAGEALRTWEEGVLAGWKKMTVPESRADFLDEIAVHRGSYAKLVKHRAGELIWMHVFGIPIFMIELSPADGC